MRGAEPPEPTIKFKYLAPNNLYVVGVGKRSNLTILSDFEDYSTLVRATGSISTQTRDFSIDKQTILERLAAQGFVYETSQIVFDMMGYESGQTIEDFDEYVVL